MDGHAERAEQYRRRAAEIRAELSDIKDKQTRDSLASIAADYEHLAKIQDMLAKVGRL